MLGPRARVKVSPLKYGKFVCRGWLTRLGLWEAVERWRLRRRFRSGFIHERDFRFFRHFEGSRGLFVDIGANLGQSALSFRIANTSCPIVSFEANPAMEHGLREVKRLLGASFDYHMHGLGGHAEKKCLYVPIIKGVPFPQCGTFHRDSLENDSQRRIFCEWTGTDRFEVCEQPIRLVRFDELKLAPEFIKIDVEGGEQEVLSGMQQTIETHRPLLMTEGNVCAAMLRDCDYQMFVYRVDSNALVEPQEGNHSLNYFFVPAEKIPSLRRSGALSA
jgi:FkbM family methyltransferase